METPEIISYLATLLMLIAYCCRTVWLRVFSIIGISMNMLFAYLILDQSLSARSIIVSGILYLIINIVQLFNEIRRVWKPQKQNLG